MPLICAKRLKFSVAGVVYHRSLTALHVASSRAILPRFKEARKLSPVTSRCADKQLRHGLSHRATCRACSFPAEPTVGACTPRTTYAIRGCIFCSLKSRTVPHSVGGAFRLSAIARRSDGGSHSGQVSQVMASSPFIAVMEKKRHRSCRAVRADSTYPCTASSLSATSSPSPVSIIRIRKDRHPQTPAPLSGPPTWEASCGGMGWTSSEDILRTCG